MEEEDNIKTNLNETGRDCEENTVSTEQNIVVGSCERSNESSGSMKYGEIVKQLSQYQAIMCQSVRWQLRVYTKKKV